jgi:polysaccharide export outer membrane protein
MMMRMMPVVSHRASLPLVWLVAALALQGCVAYSPRPHDAQPGPFEFRLGPGDRVEISVWSEQRLTLDTEIGPDGAISFPLIGHVELYGLTLDEARVALAKRLRAHLKDPVVSVALKDMRSHVVHVLGEVARPGSTPFVRGATVLAALQAAGSILPATADRSEVRVIRDRMTNPRVFRIDLEKVLAAEETDLYLEAGDVIYVPPRGLTAWDRGLRQLFGFDPSERFQKQ